MRRVFLIVLDSVGCGALPDAADYGDVGANTLAHIAEASGGLSLPTLQSLGLGNIIPIEGVAPVKTSRAAYGKLGTASKGKDTTIGHWELMGLISPQALPTYPDGFPPEVMDAFTRLTGYGWLGNRTASGTQIIAELGAEHVATGKPIVYTSADSVFQVATHVEVVPLEELYRICRIARSEILTGPHAVARVIARPFTGNARQGFTRTSDRHDFSLTPPKPTLLDRLQDAGIPTLGIGKISDIFNGHGVAESWPTHSNAEGMDALLRAVQTVASGLIFANLVDFDMLWGHRRDVAGYAAGLEAFDRWLADFLPRLCAEDLLIITADHGCDPLHAGSDHTREYVPLLVYSAACQTDALPDEANLSEVATIINRYLLADTESRQ